MNPAKCEILMQGQTGIAKKVYECVPIAEAWSAFQVMAAMRNLTGSTPDARIVSGCLASLVDAGLIKKTGRDAYRRISTELKQKTQEPKMPVTQLKAGHPASPEPARPTGPMEVLGDLSAEILGMAEHLKTLARRVEDVALAVEQDREATAKNLDGYRQLKALLKSLQGEGE